MSTITTVSGAWESLLVNGNDDISYEVVYTDSNGAPIDLTGMTFSWIFTIGGVTLTATVGSGLTVTALEGKIVLNFSATQMGTLPQGLGKHRLRVLTPTKKTLIRGALTNDT